MGHILNNNWEIETLLDLDFQHGTHRIEIIGAAKVEYLHTDIDQDHNIYFPNPETSPEIALRIRVDGVEVDRESKIFIAICDYVVSVLEDEISPVKTDITNDDFADYEDETVAELLSTL